MPPSPILRDAIERLLLLPATGRALETLQRQGGGAQIVSGVRGGAQALFAAALLTDHDRRVAFVTPSEPQRELLEEALATLGQEALSWPSTQSLGKREIARDDQGSRRLETIATLRAGKSPGTPVVASIQSLLEPIPSAAHMARGTVFFEPGQDVDEGALFEQLKQEAYQRVPQVRAPGEFARRGDIIDIFPHVLPGPVRLELWGSELESIRRFDGATQRSVEDLAHVSFFLGSLEGSPGENQTACLLEEPLLDAFCTLDSEQLDETLEGLERQERLQRALTSWRAAGEAKPTIRLTAWSLEEGAALDSRSLQKVPVEDPSRAEVLAPHVKPDQDLVLLAPRTEIKAWETALEEVSREHHHSREHHLTSSVPAGARHEVGPGGLRPGFEWPEIGLRVVHGDELMHQRSVRTKRRTRRSSSRFETLPIENFLELREGDFVVHAVHGVGQYLRPEILERDGGREEYLLIQYAKDALLYLPSARIDLVQRYVGSGGIRPRLDRLGGKTFRERKLKVLGAVRDLAADLLRVQALRSKAQGHAFGHDGEFMEDFLNAFPFEDTKDQGLAWDAVRDDMETARPMDRLICGDVGYGKTEIAMRAAFKAACAGMQTAILVPTTVLAQQHYDSFRERMRDFPVEVDMLSRFRSKKQQRQTIENAREGRVDILIGTHRIFSKDVTFSRLGLVVIDEEQRFGVTHKERFKELRATVDMLTLTATPIPRTLHLSLSGVKDISSLTTPPAGRQEIETKLGFDDDEDLIRDVLRRELGRGGQAFFLHNRVKSIDLVAARLQELVPEARLLVGHGQMPEDQLEEVMTAFAAGDADILLATTIIESGLDIPRANTIIIDRADHFGLAELHQLRGRVGRWKHKAYCRLLVPANRPLKKEARARLQAIEEFHELGAGFQIAMRDLEIRGSGNILGAEQSGHIASIGYDMYCRLLQQAVEKASAASAHSATETRQHQAEPSAAAPEPLASRPRPPRKPQHVAPEDVRQKRELEQIEEEAGAFVELGLEAFLPDDYAEDRTARLKLYREFSHVRTLEQREDAARSLRDRYGRIPPSGERLLDIFFLKNVLGDLKVQKIRFREDHYQIEFADVRPIEQNLLPWFRDIRVTAPGKALMMLPSFAKGDAERACRYLLKVFDPSAAPPKPPSEARRERRDQARQGKARFSARTAGSAPRPTYPKGRPGGPRKKPS